MAELDTNQDFGIEQTMSLDTAGVGDQDLLNDLFAPETSTADPDTITKLDEEDDEPAGGKSKKGKANPTKLAGKEDEDDIPDDAAQSPEALTKFLLGEDDDDDAEEEEEEEEDEPAKPKGKKAAAKPDEEDKPDDDDDTPENDGVIAFDTLANELADLGVFTRLEGEEESFKIESPEDFLERFKQEKQMGAQQMLTDFIGQFGQEYQDAFQAIYVKGANPREYFAQEAKIQDFSNMDMTLETNQEKVIRSVLADQGFEAEDIQAEIDKLKNYGDLEDVSKRYHKVAIKKEKQVLLEQQAAAQRALQYKQAQKQQYYDNVNAVLTDKLKAKEFDGIPLNPQLANELQDFLLVDKWKTESGETLTDFDKTILELKRPENHATKVKLGLLLKLLEKDPTLSTIQKRGVSKKSSELFKDVARQKTTAKRAVVDKKNEAPTSWFQ